MGGCQTPPTPQQNHILDILGISPRPPGGDHSLSYTDFHTILGREEGGHKIVTQPKLMYAIGKYFRWISPLPMPNLTHFWNISKYPNLFLNIPFTSQIS